MRLVKLRVGLIAAVAAIGGIMLNQPSAGQGGAEPPEPPKKSTVIMLKTEPDINPKELNHKLKIAVLESNCKCSNHDTLKADPISQGEYEAVERFMTGIRKPAKSADQPRAEIVIRKKPVLILTKPNEKDSMEWAEVEYWSGNKVKEEVKPRGKGKLTPFTTNDYQFELEEGEYPRYYTAKYEGQEKPITEEIGGVRYFSVVLEDFEGKLDDLKATFGRKDIFGENTGLVNVTSQQTFVLADFAADDPGEPGVLVDQQHVLFKAEQRNPATNRRAWICFPLKKDDVEGDKKNGKTIFDKYRGMDAYELPQEIRKTKPIEEKDDAKVGPKSEPRWIELATVKNGNFERSIKIEDAAKLRDEYKDAYYLIVWEFDPDPKREILRNAIGLREKDPKSPMGGKSRRVYVTARKIEGWRDGLTKPSAP